MKQSEVKITDGGYDELVILFVLLTTFEAFVLQQSDFLKTPKKLAY